MPRGEKVKVLNSGSGLVKESNRIYFKNEAAKNAIDYKVKKDTILILRRLQTTMRGKAVAILRTDRKNNITNHKNIIKAFTWEQACLMLENEITSLESQIRLLKKQTSIPN